MNEFNDFIDELANPDEDDNKKDKDKDDEE